MEGNIQDDRYKVEDNIIYYKYMIYIVPESKLKDKILRVVHDMPLAGHQGYTLSRSSSDSTDVYKAHV
jgi:hypothetical protein